MGGHGTLWGNINMRLFRYSHNTRCDDSFAYELDLGWVVTVSTSVFRTGTVVQFVCIVEDDEFEKEYRRLLDGIDEDIAAGNPIAMAIREALAEQKGRIKKEYYVKRVVN